MAIHGHGNGGRPALFSEAAPRCLLRRGACGRTAALMPDYRSILRVSWR